MNTLQHHVVRSLLLCAAALSPGFPSFAADDSRLIYRPIGGPWTRPECHHPYTLTIYASGRLVYEGKNCVREIGLREYEIPVEIAQGWIRQLVNAGFFDLP